MERMDLQLDRQQANEKPANISNSNGSLARTRAMTQIINHCRVLSGWTPYGEVELASILPTWMDALQTIPDHLLKASMDKATADHDWSQPFPIKAMVTAYQQLIAEDRAKRQSTPHYRADGTVACRWCLDTGYVPVATYCPTGNEWYIPVYPCECAATPISQRAPVNIRADWERNDRGQWIPSDSSTSPRCQCGFCRQRRHH